ncbi:MAG: carboxypeptidase-like regulatory domain-containing protein [Candidatus Synoicihabitans palmerolidicus]|nr:carboxypeptidase-like regulatory domain-containing protein [Candidatus Synoicihabitans palmerolidicus]
MCALGCLTGGLLMTSQPAGAEFLSGRVRDANNNSYLIGATVSVEGAARSTSTDHEGRYVLRDLAPGDYEVEVAYLGYDPVVQQVTIASGIDQRLDFAPGSEVLAMDAFVVEGIREGQARALQQKLAAINVIDVIAAEMGKLPDGNAAEALRHIPGVTAQIDQDEGVMWSGAASPPSSTTSPSTSARLPSRATAASRATRCRPISSPVSQS